MKNLKAFFKAQNSSHQLILRCDWKTDECETPELPLNLNPRHRAAPDMEWEGERQGLFFLRSCWFLCRDAVSFDACPCRHYAYVSDWNFCPL